LALDEIIKELPARMVGRKQTATDGITVPIPGISVPTRGIAIRRRSLLRVLYHPRDWITAAGRGVEASGKIGRPPNVKYVFVQALTPGG